MVFDGTGATNHRQPRNMRQRIAVPVTKLKVCRLGITAASDAIEIHGGNGYIETWPVARLLRDAQVNTIWEGPDNILCLDVRRGIEQAPAHETLLARLRMRVGLRRRTRGATPDWSPGASRTSTRRSPRGPNSRSRRRRGAAVPARGIHGRRLRRRIAREQAAWEWETRGADRKALIARLYARRYLADPGPLRGIDAETDEALERFDELVEGALRV